MSVSFTASGSGIGAGSISALASAVNPIWGKSVMAVDVFLNNFGTSKTVSFICADDNTSTTKLRIDGNFNGAGNGCNFGLGGNAGGFGPNATVTSGMTGLPASGQDVVLCWFSTNSSSGVALFNLGTGAKIVSGTHGAVTLPASGGFVRVNHAAINNSSASPVAMIVGGAAIYAGTPPDTSFSSANWTTAPSSGDTGIVAMWEMNDAFSGTSPSSAAATVGSEALNLTASQYTWTNDSGTNAWFPGQTPTTATISPLAQTIAGGATEQYTGTIKDGSSNTISGEPVTWSSSNTGVATISSSGLATAVGVGTTTIEVADVRVPTVNASTTLTVQTQGTLSLSSTGKGVSAASVSGLATLQTTMSVKWVQKVDSLRTLGAALTASSSAVGFLDSDGANTNHKLAFGWNVAANGNLNLKLHVFGVGDFSGPAAAYTNLTANGTYVICEIDTINNSQHFNVYQADGATQIAGFSGSTALPCTLPTSGTPGVFTLNKDNSGTVFTQQANVYGGCAFYNSVLTGTQVTSAPLATDTGIVAGWYMADATSGSAVTSAAAFVGGQALSLTNQTWDSDLSLWAPSTGQVPTTAVITPGGATLGVGATTQLTGVINDGSGNPIVGTAVTWTSSATGVATVSATGLVTAVAIGQTTITLADNAAPTVSTTATITVTGLGTLSFSSSGSGLSANVPLVANIQTAASVKWVQKTDQLISLGANLKVPVMSVDQDGAGTNCKFRIEWATDGAGNIQLGFSVPGQGGAVGPALAQASLPVAGNYIICEVDATGTTQHFNAYTAAQSQIAGLSGATSINLGTNWGIVPGANGRVSVNKDPSGLFSNQSALIYGGMAIYNTILTGSAVYAVPTAQDTGIVAGWFMNDATSGSTPSTAAAFAGGQVLTLTNNTWISNASAWAAAQVPTSATLTPSTASITTAQTQQLTGMVFDANGLPITGELVNYTSSNPSVATVNSSGGVTPIAAGTATITMADAAIPSVSATSVITVTTALATSATLTCTPYSTSGSGSPISGLVATWSSSNTAVATVSATGLVTGMAAGTATITGTISGQSATCVVTVT